MSEAHGLPPSKVMVRRPLRSVAETFAAFALLPALQVPDHETVAPDRVTDLKVQDISSVVRLIGPIRTIPSVGDEQEAGLSDQSPTMDAGRA